MIFISLLVLLRTLEDMSIIENTTCSEQPSHSDASAIGQALTIAVAAGGTGGHIYPGLAVADELSARGHRVVFFGSDDRMENQIIPARGYRLHTSRIHGLTGVSSALSLPLRLSIAVARSIRALREERVDAVFGTGGYPSMPALIGGRTLGLPTLVHESNSLPGLANRVAARLGAEVAVSNRSAAAGFASVAAAAVTGMPVDSSLARLDRQALRARARRELGVPEHGTLVLVSGGSLGAKQLNSVALELGSILDGNPDIHFLIKIGDAGTDGIESTAVTTVNYLSRMDIAYAAADVMVARAGASTVAELEHLGLPAVLVPLPSSAGGHQEANAHHLKSLGLAEVIDEAELTVSGLDAAITRLLTRAEERPTPGPAGAGSIHTRAAATLADTLLELISAVHN